MINSQESFDKLFEYLYDSDRAIMMKAIDAIEKITVQKIEFLQKHKQEIITLSANAKTIELKWHLAQLLGRIKYTKDEMLNVWKLLKEWLLNKNESKIVRVNSLQTLYECAKLNSDFKSEFNEIIKEISKENIPSINARIKKLKLDLYKNTNA